MSSTPSLKRPAAEPLVPPQPDKLLRTYLAAEEAHIEELRQSVAVRDREYNNHRVEIAGKLIDLGARKEIMENKVKTKQAQIRDLEEDVKQLGLQIGRIKGSKDSADFRVWSAKTVLELEQEQWSRKRDKAKVVLKIGKANAEFVANIEKAKRMKVAFGNRIWVQPHA